MNTYNIKISRASLNRLHDIVKNCLAKCDPIEAERKELNKLTMQADGTNGIQRRKEGLAALDAREDQIKHEATIALHQQYKEIQAFMDGQTALEAAQLSVGSCALINADLINTPEELNRLLEAEPGNYTLHRMAEKYSARKAKEDKNWRDEFILVSNEDKLRYCVKGIFNMALSACSDYNGHGAMEYRIHSSAPCETIVNNCGMQDYIV